MTDLAVAKPREFHGKPRAVVSMVMASDSRLFEGAAVKKHTTNGTVVNVAAEAAAQFVGFVAQDADNRAGVGTVTSNMIDVVIDADVWLTCSKAAAGNWALSDIGSTVYAFDSDTFTTDVGTNNLSIGKILAIDPAALGVNSGKLLVRCVGPAARHI